MPERADFNRRVDRVREVLHSEAPPDKDEDEDETEEAGPSEETVREVQHEAEE